MNNWDPKTRAIRIWIYVRRHYGHPCSSQGTTEPLRFPVFSRVHVRNKGSESSLPRLDLLLSILCPSSLHVQWMSILPFIWHFELGVWCPYGNTDLEPYLLRLLSMSGDQTSQLRSVALSLQACHSLEFCQFTKAFQDAVVHLLKMPNVQSVKISGASFLSLDFLRTHIRQLDVNSYYPYPYSRNPEGRFSIAQPIHRYFISIPG